MSRLFAALGFAIGSAWQNFHRNLAISLAGVFTMSLILFMVGATMLSTHSVNSLLSVESSKASKMKVFVQDGASLPSILNTLYMYQRDPRVLNATFENKDAALKEFKQIDPTGGNAIEAGLPNPLPASINLDVNGLADLEQLDKEATSNPIVDPSTHTNFDQKVISRLQSLINIIQAIGLAISAVLGFISLVVIMNTIRTAVYVRRTEIEIMKLVGATDWFVRWPFILEGMLGGLLAALVSGLTVSGAYRLLVGGAHGFLIGSISYDQQFMLTTLGALAAGGIALGAFGSYLGVRRFLSV